MDKIIPNNQSGGPLTGSSVSVTGSIVGASVGLANTVLAGATPNGTNDGLLVTGRGAYGNISFAVGGAYLSYQTGVAGRTASWSAGGATYCAHVCDSILATEQAGGGALTNLAGTSTVSVAAGKVAFGTAGGTATMSAAGAQWSGFKWATASKTSNYTVLATDAGTVFDNSGAAGAVTFTLPAIGTTLGQTFTFFVTTAQTVNVTSGAGDKLGTKGAATTYTTASVGGSITVVAVSANQWAVTSAILFA